MAYNKLGFSHNFVIMYSVIRSNGFTGWFEIILFTGMLEPEDLVGSVHLVMVAL